MDAELKEDSYAPFVKSNGNFWWDPLGCSDTFSWTDKLERPELWSELSPDDQLRVSVVSYHAHAG